MRLVHVLRPSGFNKQPLAIACSSFGFETRLFHEIRGECTASVWWMSEVDARSPADSWTPLLAVAWSAVDHVSFGAYDQVTGTRVQI